MIHLSKNDRNQTWDKICEEASAGALLWRQSIGVEALAATPVHPTGTKIRRARFGTPNLAERSAASCVFIGDNDPAELIRPRIEQGEPVWGVEFYCGC